MAACKDININKMGECILCSKMTSNQCSICFGHYCSVECQQMDWPKHKFDCRPVPALLIKDNSSYSTSVRQNSAHLHNNYSKERSYESDRNNKNKKNNNNNINDSDINSKFMDLKMVNNNSTVKIPPTEFTNHSEINFQKSENSDSNNAKNIKLVLPISNSTVVITYAISAAVVFCRSLEHNNDYVKNLADILQYSLTAKPLQKLPQRNNIILAKFEGVYYRAIVIKIENNLVKVFFTEFGNVDYIKLEDLKEIDCEDIKYRSQYICRVDLCEIPENLTPEQEQICIKYLLSLYGERFKILYNGQLSRKTKVKLQIIENGQLLNSKIVELIKNGDYLITSDTKPTTTEAKTISSSSSIPVKTVSVTESTSDTNSISDNISTITEYYIKDIIFKELHSKRFELKILNTLDEDGLFYAILPQDMDSLNDLQHKLIEYGTKNTTPYKPRFEELCVVKYEDLWFRAVCYNYVKKEKKFEFTFLDYGNYCLVGVENIRCMNTSLFFPCNTITCCLKDTIINELSKEVLIRLNEKIQVNKSIIVEHVNIIYNEDTITHELIVPDISKMLTK